jgi:hypothetical protein
VTAALLTPPADSATLQQFCRRIHPGGPGWRSVYRQLAANNEVPAGDAVNIPRGILCMVLGCIAVYSVLFATGFWLYGQALSATVLALVATGAAAGIVRLRFND